MPKCHFCRKRGAEEGEALEVTLWLIPNPGTKGSAIYKHQNVFVPRCGACARRHRRSERLPWLLVIGLAVAGFFAGRLESFRDMVGVPPDESATEVGAFFAALAGGLGLLLGWLIASMDLGGGRRPVRAFRDYPAVQVLWREGWRPASPSPGSLKKKREPEDKPALKGASVADKKPKAREWGNFFDSLRASRDAEVETGVPPRRFAAFRRTVVETLKEVEGIETSEALRLFDRRIALRCPGCGWNTSGDRVSLALALGSAAGSIATGGSADAGEIANALRTGRCSKCGGSDPWRAAWK